MIYLQTIEKNEFVAMKRFKEIYLSFKKGSLSSLIEIEHVFLFDTTGSMALLGSSIVNTVSNVLSGAGCITKKLKRSYPDVEFDLRGLS